MIGERIGAYAIVQQIGEGGMGTVWLAEHTMLGSRAAIKMLHIGISNQADLTTRFFNEARAAATIQDPGIVQIFDFGQHIDGRAYIVMELLDGEALDRRLNRLGRLSVRDALRIMRQVATSLGAAHKRGIVHRDLKPENVFLVRDAEVASGERAKLLDFGIAKMADDAGMKTATSVVMGTPMFMSPEQCRGAGKVDQRSDVYSVGCLLFTLLTGRTPFFGEGPGDIIAMHLRERPPVPSTLAGGIPHAVDSLVLRCLEKDPARRFVSGGELAEALEAVAASAVQTSSKHDVSSAEMSSLVVAHATTLSGYPQVANEARASTQSGNRRRSWLFAGIAAGLFTTSAVVLAVWPDAKPDGARKLVNTGSSSPAGDQPQPPPPEHRQPAPPHAPALPSTVAGAKLAPAEEKAVASAPFKTSVPAGSSHDVAEASRNKAAPLAPAPARAPLVPAPSTAAPSATTEKARAAACAVQTAKLEAFLKTFRTMKLDTVVREARSLSTSCLDRGQRKRLAAASIRAACSLDDKVSVLRLFNFAESASLRPLCAKFLSVEEIEGESPTQRDGSKAQ